jgi:hypothetical protein
MPSWIDESLYPDCEPPKSFEAADRIDFLARLCSAWDFGILPREESIREIRKVEWREAVDACRLLTSHSYALLRQWHQLPPVPYLGDAPPYIRDDPNLKHV